MTKTDFFLFFSKKSINFAVEIGKIDVIMAHMQADLQQLKQSVEEIGVLVKQENHGFPIKGINLVFPDITITLCLRGKARAMYDMQEMTQSKNDLGVILPGHIMQPIDCTDDYLYASMNISAELFSDLKANIFSYDYEKFNTSPLCHLTDEQAQRLLSILLLLEDISLHRFDDLEHRRQMLLSQLAVAYEFVNYYRKEQDKQLKTSRHASRFTQFCDLVVMHYREEKDLQFYANQMSISTKQLSKIIREVTHGVTPKEWIEQYVIAQAKRLIEAQPDKSLKLTAYSLGFSEPSSFYRYFKRTTGMTPKEYREKSAR